MTREEYTFAAERSLPVVVEDGRRYLRICEIKKCFPDTDARRRGQHPYVKLVLLDQNQNSVTDVSPEMVSPAEPEKFHESLEAFRRNFPSMGAEEKTKK